MRENSRILVLGASSWLGYLLINKLNHNYPANELGGTIHSRTISFDHDAALHRAGCLNDFKSVLSRFQPTTVVNFLRGEDEKGLQIHQYIIDFCGINNVYYLYASSALALDGYPKEIKLTEETVAKGVTPYGAFKAACENLLYNATCRWGILRFASVQGWVPHKATRNEVFLNKLAKGQTIKVERGVLQNRMLADTMIDGISEIVSRQLEGVIHFGAIDGSEEYLFLRKQAELFGYDPELIVSGEKREVNLVTVPNRIFKELGEKYSVTEQDTLEALSGIKGLAKYKNKVYHGNNDL